MSDKHLVLGLYPTATCTRFPIVQPSSRPTRFIIKLSPGSSRFATGNTSAQAWRQAYAKILARRQNRSAYLQLRDGAQFEIDMGKDEMLRLACCDCGLVHDIAFAMEENGKLGIAMKRNERATAVRRRRESAESSGEESKGKE